MNLDFLKPHLGDDLFAQVAEKLEGVSGLTLINASDGSYIPKAKFDDERTKVKTLTAQVNDLTQQLTDAQKNAGDVDALNQRITQLTQDVADRDARLETMSLDYDIKDAARAAKARDVDIVVGLLDKSKITKKDGKLSGVDEQFKALRESKGFLFDSEQAGSNRGGFDGRQDILGGNDGTSTNAAVNDAIRLMAGRG